MFVFFYAKMHLMSIYKKRKKLVFNCLSKKWRLIESAFAELDKNTSQQATCKIMITNIIPLFSRNSRSVFPIVRG